MFIFLFFLHIFMVKTTSIVHNFFFCVQTSGIKTLNFDPKICLWNWGTKLGYIVYAYCATRDVLFKLLLRNLVIRADAYLMDLIASDAILFLPMKDHIRTLKSLIASIIKIPRTLIFMNLESLTEDDNQM